jgi:hypothetical protein
LELELNITDNKESIKGPYKTECDSRQRDVIITTECLTDPCPGFYTDALSQSLLVVCKNPKHTGADTYDNAIERGAA